MSKLDFLTKFVGTTSAVGIKYFLSLKLSFLFEIDHLQILEVDLCQTLLPH